MHRTASIKLDTTPEQAKRLAALQAAYADACNRLVPVVIEHRCWNRVALHQRTYTRLRQETPLGSQMTCNAIFSVCKAYKAQRELGRIRKEVPVPALNFRRASIHFDKRTYTLTGDTLSLYTLDGRIAVRMILGDYQRALLAAGSPTEAELIYRKGRWYFNLVIKSEECSALPSGPVLGVDVGENNLAATSTGKLFDGGRLRHERDRHLSLRRRLQSNGSQSARQLLCKVSGREQRHVTHINHETSRAIVTEAQRIGASTLAVEDLTHIRNRIKAGRRMRSRLHRWAWRQFQRFVDYKAQAAGIRVVYVDPAYTSQTCSQCGQIGVRRKHRFACACGFLAHSDVNGARNIAEIAPLFSEATAAVNQPTVAVCSHADHKSF
jgi:IS605 OrfB family transposase